MHALTLLVLAVTPGADYPPAERIAAEIRRANEVARESPPSQVGTPRAKAAGHRNPADPNEDHRCPSCGTYQYVQAGQHTDGSHTHTCPACGTSWRHGGSLGYPGTRGGSKPTPTKQQTTPPPAVQFGMGGSVGQFGGGLQFQLGRYPSGGG